MPRAPQGDGDLKLLTAAEQRMSQAVANISTRRLVFVLGKAKTSWQYFLFDPCLSAAGVSTKHNTQNVRNTIKTLQHLRAKKKSIRTRLMMNADVNAISCEAV